MAEIETCPKIVVESSGWHYHSCGKPIKRRGMCGIHAAAEERVEKNSQALAARKVEAQGVVDRLATHNIPAHVSYDGEVRLSVSTRALADLLDTTTPDPAPREVGRARREGDPA